MAAVLYSDVTLCAVKTSHNNAALTCVRHVAIEMTLRYFHVCDVQQWPKLEMTCLVVKVLPFELKIYFDSLTF